MEGSTMLSYLEPPALHSCCASSRLCATICRLTTCSAASHSAHSLLTHTTPTTGASQVREGVREHERERERTAWLTPSCCAVFVSFLTNVVIDKLEMYAVAYQRFILWKTVTYCTFGQNIKNHRRKHECFYILCIKPILQNFLAKSNTWSLFCFPSCSEGRDVGSIIYSARQQTLHQRLLHLQHSDSYKPTENRHTLSRRYAHIMVSFVWEPAQGKSVDCLWGGPRNQ